MDPKKGVINNFSGQPTTFFILESGSGERSALLPLLLICVCFHGGVEEGGKATPLTPESCCNLDGVVLVLVDGE